MHARAVNLTTALALMQARVEMQEWAWTLACPCRYPCTPADEHRWEDSDEWSESWSWQGLQATLTAIQSLSKAWTLTLTLVLPQSLGECLLWTLPSLLSHALFLLLTLSLVLFLDPPLCLHTPLCYCWYCCYGHGHARVEGSYSREGVWARERR